MSGSSAGDGDGGGDMKVWAKKMMLKTDRKMKVPYSKKKMQYDCKHLKQNNYRVNVAGLV